MIKYHVKFTYQDIVPIVSSNSSYNDVRVVEVDTVWEFEEWVNVFTYIYRNYNVISDVTVTTTTLKSVRTDNKYEINL